jgi:5-methylcytosine-specific restriction protein A
MPKRVCNVTGCPTLTEGTPRCTHHTRTADRARGTARQRGYDRTHQRDFREAVLARNPWCTLCRRQPATVADHHPLDRRTLQARGLNPNDPRHGRGLCASCHGQETARHQPGGWNLP